MTSLIERKLDELTVHCRAGLPLSSGRTRFQVTVEFEFWEPIVVGEVKLSKNLIVDLNGKELNARDDQTTATVNLLREQFQLSESVCGLTNFKWYTPGYWETIRRTASGKMQIIFLYVMRRPLMDVYQIIFSEI